MVFPSALDAACKIDMSNLMDDAFFAPMNRAWCLLYGSANKSILRCDGWRRRR